MKGKEDHHRVMRHLLRQIVLYVRNDFRFSYFVEELTTKERDWKEIEQKVRILCNDICYFFTEVLPLDGND